MELLVVRLLGDREAHLGDDLAGVERGGEHSLEVVVRRDLAGVGHDRRAGGERGGGIVGGGVVVGEAAADGAAVADRRVADVAGEGGERRIVRRRLAGDPRMGGAAADGELAALHRHALERGDAGRG